jgi:hypothetical protein
MEWLPIAVFDPKKMVYLILKNQKCLNSVAENRPKAWSGSVD